MHALESEVQRTMAKLLEKLWWILALSACLWGLSTLAGRIESCWRLHAFIVSGDSNRTNLTYRNTGLLEPTVTTFDDTLPSPSLCGADYERCNVLITSNSDGSIRIVLLPLESGIGLVSFDYSIPSDSLVFREKFLLPQNEPICTYVYFVKQVIGYCLEVDPPRIRAFRIYIGFGNLGSSSIQQDTFVTLALDDISGLSNFAFFAQGKLDDCFPNEGNHVLFLNDGCIFDHSFSDEQIYKYVHGQIDATCSRLHRIGTMCDLAVHCNNSALVFDTREQEQLTSVFTEAEYGQTFFCLSEDFVSFRNETLTLHHQNREQFGNTVLFDFEKIHRGYCLEVKDNFLLVASVDEGRAVLVNFRDASYQEVGVSDPSTMVLANVEGRIAFVNNGSETYLYNFGLECTPKPLILPENFILATSAVFSTRVLDQCRCLDPVATTTIIPSELSVPTISPSSPAVLVSGSPSTSTASMLETRPVMAVSVSPTSTPANKPASNSSNTGGIIGGVVAGAVVIVTTSLLFTTVLLICKWSKEQKSVRLELQELDQDSIKLSDDLTNTQNGDPSSAKIHKPQMQQVQNEKRGQEDEPQVVLTENNLQEISEPLRTEVPARDLKQEELGTDSGSTDTNAILHDPQHNFSLVLHNVVCEEVGEQTVTEIQSNPTEENNSQSITFEAEVHQDGDEGVSNSPESPIINFDPVPNTSMSPVHSAAPEHSAYMYTQPLTDTDGQSSRLLVPNMPPDLRENSQENHNSSPTEMNGVDDSSTDCLLPLQNTSNSQARLVVSDANCSSFHPDDLRDRCHLYNDRTNSVQYRQLVADVGGGHLYNEEPNNDRHLMDDPDILRQISTDSEESRG